MRAIAVNLRIMRQHQAIFANLICKFGEQDLLDYAEQIVLPAFTDDTLVREYGDSSMHFYEVELAIIDDDPVVVGKFIHNTMIRRTHRFVEGRGQIEDEAALESAPSAFFILFLSNHRLIYFAETARAPELSTFRNTLEGFLEAKHEQFARAERRRLSRPGARVTKADIYQRVAKPTLTIIPLSGRASIRDFIAQYERVRSLRITVVRRNDEVDPAGTMNELDELAQQASSPNATVLFSNNAGLSADGVAAILESVSPQGNQEALVKGVDTDGRPLRGSNEDFSIKPTIDNVPPGIGPRALFLIQEFKKLLTRNALRAPTGDRESRQRALNLIPPQ